MPFPKDNLLTAFFNLIIFIHRHSELLYRDFLNRAD